DADVVRDHHEIVELHAVLDHGVLDRAAVDRRVRADLDVVADHDRAELRHLDPPAMREILGETEAVAADHRPRLKEATAADADAIEHDDARDETRVRADLDVRADRAARTDHDPVADLAPRSDDRMRTDLRARRDLRVWR